VSDMAGSTALSVRTRPIVVDEYHRMADVGILRPDEQIELLNGRIIEMPPLGTRHAYAVIALDARLQAMLGGRAVICSRTPLRLDRLSEPQPDILVVRQPIARYASSHPTPEDTLLVIEVAESTLPYDCGEKLSAYARLGVPEYWILDLVSEHLEIYREPDGDRYGSQEIVGRGQRVAPRAFPNDSIAVNDILPPLPE
jgi:Uma2 family endonuclease